MKVAAWVLVREKERQVQELREDNAKLEYQLGRMSEKLANAEVQSAKRSRRVAVLTERLVAVADQRPWRAFAGSVGLAMVGLAGNLLAGSEKGVALLLLLVGFVLYIGSVFFKIPNGERKQ